MPSIFDEIGDFVQDALKPEKPKKPKKVVVKRDRSHDVPIPQEQRDDVARAARDNKAAQRQAAKEKRKQEAHDKLAASQQAKIWGREQGITPWELDLIKARKPPRVPKPKTFAEYNALHRHISWQERQAALERERKERAKLSDAAMVPGSKERKQFVSGLSPERRKELTEGRKPPAPWKPPTDLRKAKPQAAGMFGLDFLDPSGHFRDFGEDLWGATKTVGSGLYGGAMDYGGALYGDVTKDEAAWGRTRKLLKRDVLGTIAMVEGAIPEVDPSWMPEWMKGDILQGTIDPETGEVSEIGLGAGRWSREETTAAGREAFGKAWSGEDKFLTALLAVPVVGQGLKVASAAGIRASLRRANPGMSEATIAKLARKESKRPGYIAANYPGVVGGIKPRMIGVKRTVGEATEGATFGKPQDLLRYEERGTPGYSVTDIKGAKHAVFRDHQGRAQGYASVDKNGSVKVYVEPHLRGNRVATELYGALERAGVDIPAVSGKGVMTAQGAALAASVGRVPAKPWARSPQGRAIQRGYDAATDIIEDFLGPNAPMLAQLAARPVGKWRTSNRAARAKQRRDSHDIQRQGAVLDRDTRYMAAALTRGDNGSIDRAALYAALQGPKQLSPRRGVELAIEYFKRQPDPPTPVIETLQAALEGNHIDSKEFKKGLDAMRRTAARSDSLASAYLGMTAQQLADRRNLIVRQYEELGLLDDDGLPPSFGGELPGPAPLRGRMADLEERLADADPSTPEGQALATEYAEAVQAYSTAQTRVSAMAERIADDEVEAALDWEGRGTQNKNYLPPGAQTREGFSKLFHEVYDRVVEGYTYGHDWYRASGETILRRAGGDVDRADRLAALAAIYSPQRAVTPNIGLALRAEQEFRRSKTVTLGSADQQNQALAVMRGEDWRELLAPDGAPKIRRFYGNLLKYVDRDRMVERGYNGREVTVDGWIAAAFKYGSNTKNASINNNQYFLLERVIQEIADDLGIEPEQAQAAMWVSIKASNDDTLTKYPRAEQLERASGSFSAGVDLETHNVRFAFEAASDQIPEYWTWSPEVQKAFLEANADNVLLTMQGHGFYSRLTDHGIGVYRNERGEIEQNPMAALEIAVGSLPTDTRLHLAPGDEALYDAIAAIVGKHLKQESQGWIRPLVAKAKIEHTKFRLKHDVTPEEILQLTALIDDVGYISPTKDGLIFARYNPEQILDAPDQATKRATAQAYSKRVLEALEEVYGADVVSTLLDERRLEGGAHRGGYLAGLEQYGSAIDSSGRPDLFGGLDRDLSDSSAEIRDAFLRNPEGAARGYGARAAPEVDPYYWEAHGYFPHRGPNEFVPGGIAPTALAAGGQTVGVPKMTRAFERRRNELKLFNSGRASMDPETLVNTVRGRIKYSKTLEGREYLYDHGQTIVPGAQIPKGDFYFVRNPETLPTKIPDDVKAILARPDKFMKGDEAALNTWRNEWLRPGDDGMPPEWADDLSNVRLVPAGNVETLLSDAFYSAPRGGLASVAALLNSAARSSVIYLPYGGTRYVVRNTVQNMILLAVNKPTAFLNIRKAVHAAWKDKEFWDGAVVETGGFPAAAGLPERSVRGTRGAQRAEKAVTKGSRTISSWLSNIADEPFRVASWMRYAEEYGFKGKARQRELLNSKEPGIVAVRDQIGQMVRDDMLDFNTLSPAMQEGASRFLFILPFQAAAAKWPITFMRDQTMKAAVIALVAAQHEREESFWGEVSTLSGRVVSLGWLSPVMPIQENLGLAAETIRAAMDGRLDLNALGSLLSPTWRDTVKALGRGGVSFEQLAKTWVPGFASGQQINAFVRGEQSLDEAVDRYLGTRPWRWSQGTKGKAAEWAESAADLWGAVPKELVEAKALQLQYDSEVEGKTEHQKAAAQAEYFFKTHPEDAGERSRWLERIRTTKTEDLDNWTDFFDREMGWEDVSKIDSRVEVYDDLDKWLAAHPEEEKNREAWRKDIARADDDRLSGWRSFLEEQEEEAVAS